MEQNSVHVDIHQSKVVITRLNLDKYYKNSLEEQLSLDK